MIRSLPLALGAALLAAAPAPGGAAPATPATRPSSAAHDPDIPFERYRLANGLEVILHHDDRVPLVAVDVWYHVGSGDEVPGKSGFAHLFEHMMFQGTKYSGADSFFRTLQAYGASETNGTTSFDRTNYYEVVPAHQLEVALWLESDRMGFLLTSLDEKQLANQREVVKNERRQRYENVPYGLEMMATHEQLYAQGHPYRHLVIGTPEDLTNASLEDVRAFFLTWYAPSNATLAVAGDFDRKAIKGQIEKYFGSLPTRPVPDRRMVPPTPITRPKRVTVKDPFAKLRRVHYAWHTPPAYGAGDAELEIVAHALGADGTGRLYRRLVLERQLAQDVSVYVWSKQMSSVFNVVVDLRPDADLADVEAIVNAELERVRSAPLSEREHRRVVTANEASVVWGLEQLLARVELLQTYNHYHGDPGWLSRDLDRFRKTNVRAIRAAAEKYLAPTNRVEVISMPADARGGK